MGLEQQQQIPYGWDEIDLWGHRPANLQRRVLSALLCRDATVAVTFMNGLSSNAGFTKSDALRDLLGRQKGWSDVFV